MSSVEPAAHEATSSPYAAHATHLRAIYAALFLLIMVQAVSAQALPIALQDVLMADKVAEAVASVAAASAALEFLLLPLTAALSDTIGRKPLLLAIPLLVVLSRVTVVWRPVLAAIILSRLLVGMLVNYYFIFVSVASADLFKADPASLASLEGKAAACWGCATGLGMLIGGHVLSAYGVRATHALSGARPRSGHNTRMHGGARTIRTAPHRTAPFRTPKPSSSPKPYPLPPEPSPSSPP